MKFKKKIQTDLMPFVGSLEPLNHLLFRCQYNKTARGPSIRPWIYHVLLKRKFAPGNISAITYRFCLGHNSLEIKHYFTHVLRKILMAKTPADLTRQ